MARIGTSTTPRTKESTRNLVGPGVAAGIAGAVVMMVVAMIVSAVAGAGFWSPLMLIGATFLGVGWNDVPIWSGILGLITHLVIGAGFGVLFVALARNIASTGAKFAAGLAYGAAVYLFMTFLIMPWADPVMYAAIDKGRFFIWHLLYGATLPLALMGEARRSFIPRRRHAV